METVQVRPSDSRGDIAEGILATTDFVECYQTHYRRLIRALRLSGADRSTAEDVAQEAFARSLVHWRRVRKGTNPVGYVYTAAFRLWQRSQLPLVEATAIVPPPSTPAAEGAVTTSLAIEGALAAMPPKRRACAVLCLVVGVSTRDASNALGIAEGTVRKHIEDARRDIRAACASD
jgi:DNA-directed RNA polymerase specialized sigma24 family protein